MGLLDKLNQFSNKMNEVANSVTGTVNNYADKGNGLANEALGKVDGVLDRGEHHEDSEGNGLGGQPCGVYLSNGNEIYSLGDSSEMKEDPEPDILRDI